MPSRNCQVLIRTLAWLAITATSVSTLLFLFRVNGVYYDSLRARVCFSCMWLFAFATLLVFPMQYTAAASMPPHALCSILSVKRYSFLPLIPVAFYDWVIFGAISFRVMKVFAPNTHWRGMCKAFITGADIGTIPRALLRTGQFYFL